MPLPSAAVLTVATYNLYLGADLSLTLEEPRADGRQAVLTEVGRQLEVTAFPRRCAAVADLVARHRPDVLGVQELCTWSVDGQPLWDYEALLLAALAQRGTPYDVVCRGDTFHGAGTLPWHGRTARLGLVGANALLRRRDCDLPVTASWGGLFRAAMVVAPTMDAEVSVARGWCAVTLAVGGSDRPVTVVNTHTEAYDPGPRDRQIEELLRVLPDGPVVVLGDLNATPDTTRLPDGLRDAWLAAGNPEDPQRAATCGQAADLSNPVSTLHERIDYVLVRDLTVTDCLRFGAGGEDRSAAGLWPSDHAGVCATLRA